MYHEPDTAEDGQRWKWRRAGKERTSKLEHATAPSNTQIVHSQQESRPRGGLTCPTWTTLGGVAMGSVTFAIYRTCVPFQQ